MDWFLLVSLEGRGTATQDKVMKHFYPGGTNRGLDKGRAGCCKLLLE